MLNQIDIQDIVTIAKEAGNAIMQVYKQDFEVEYKKDSSPLTLADKKANDIIEDGLNKLSVSFPILSEEGQEIPYKDRKHWEYFWLVDPLDGTKEFVKKNGEFTVNIALIHKDTPVLGVVYAPDLDICYWAKQYEGAYKDGQKLPIKTARQRNTYKIVVSRSHMSDETKIFIDAINANKEKELISIGSSLKICLVAEGEADIYPRLGPTMEWDTAAANIIAIEASLSFVKFDKQISSNNIQYNKCDLINSSFVVYANK
jgi:3'(2'), 5'-bisphosphate nucleotidase